MPVSERNMLMLLLLYVMEPWLYVGDEAQAKRGILTYLLTYYGIAILTKHKN